MTRSPSPPPISELISQPGRVLMPPLKNTLSRNSAASTSAAVFPSRSPRRASFRQRPLVRRGLTLTDVLIALLTIALLFQIGVVALEASRESARLHACQDNLRQIGQAIHAHEESAATLSARRMGISLDG